MQVNASSISITQWGATVRTIVLGAGVVGVTTAWYLAKAGHDVVVLDRQASAAMETSFANGGQIAVGHASPWAKPETPGDMLRYLGKEDAPFYFRLKMDPMLWSWGLKFFRNCTASRLQRGREILHRLSNHSLACLKDIRVENSIDYHQQDKGILSVYRSTGTFEHARKDAANYAGAGPGFEILKKPEVLEMEPALKAAKVDLVGGLLSKGDESGDARLFTEKLAEICKSMGVEFCFDAHISGFENQGSKLLAVRAKRTKKGRETSEEIRLEADAFVMALGSYSPLLARELGLKIPVYPVKGYAVTVPVSNPSASPSISLSDEDNRVVVTPMGDKLRAAGTAEIAGYDTSLTTSRCRNVLRVVKELFPDAGDAEKAEFWTGLRPMTPDGPPILGQAGPENLYLNTGHGTLGWTQACGSAQIVADLVSGVDQKISLDGLTIARYL
jgi:D-amino-acid dehydrogenase